jgi:hypothetical protein
VPSATTPATPERSSCHASGAPWASAPIFPPKDADQTAVREFLSRSPWPEVVFACAR